jgi:hypothetical protein
MEHGDAIEMLVARAKEEEPIVTRLVAQGVHPITAHIMAGDILSAKRATEMVERGEMPAERATHLVGSFARWDWVLTMLAAGRIHESWLALNVCDLWSGSDPDDTNPHYLALWERLRTINGGVIRDGRPLPKGAKGGLLRVYRGGPAVGLPDGFAWTTDPKVAQRFAMGAGARIPIKGGVVIAGDVKPGYVLAFITGRGESEVIVSPRHVQEVHVKGRP